MVFVIRFLGRLAGGVRLAAIMLSVAVASGAAVPARAATPAEIDRLWELLKMDQVIAVMRAEGLAYGAHLDAEMLDGKGGSDWQAAVSRIYDLVALTRVSKAGFRQALAPQDVAAVSDFFASALGVRIVDLELAARNATLDPEVEAAARDRGDEMRADGGSRVDLLTRYVEANELVESNVAGSLTANYRFYKGLAEGGALDPEMDDDAILAEVWADEPSVRQDAESMVFAFVALAYAMLTDDELEAYISLSAAPAGRALNRAVDAAFDPVFDDISQALGLALARRLVGEDL